MDQAQEQSPREQIRAFLSQSEPQGQPEQPEAEAPQAEAEQAQEQEAVEEQEAPEAAPEPDADWAEVELEGDALRVPPKFREAFLKNADYTQKTQALAEERRQVQMRAQALETQAQALQQLQPAFAQLAALENAVQSFQKVDWETLRQTDPLDFATKRADYAALLQQKQETQGYIAEGTQYLQTQRRVATEQAVRAAEPIIRKAIPDWGPEKDKVLTEFALKNGATPQMLSGLAAEPWAVILLEKARKYDELQASRAQLPKKVQNLSPVAKPGAKQTVQSAESASYRKNMQQLEASARKGKTDPAALRAVLKAHLK